MPGLAGEIEMQGFVSGRGVGGFEHIPDVSGTIWDRFGVRAQRTYVFINDDGTITVKGYGSLEQDVLALIAS